jgi:hypothetical protein
LRSLLERNVIDAQVPVVADGSQVLVELFQKQAAISNVVVLAVFLTVANDRRSFFGGFRVDVVLLQSRKNGLDGTLARPRV